MHDSNSPASQATAHQCSRLSGALLGAAIAATLGGVGLCVPFVAAGSDLVLRGMEVAIPPPTRVVLIAAPWGFVLFGIIGATALVLKERVATPSVALATNAVVLVLAALVSATTLFALVMPLIQMGRSLVAG